MKNEIWRPVNGYEYYMVSNLGKVKSLARETNNQYRFSERILKRLKNNSTGYYTVNLYKDRKMKSHLVHSLVAFAFPEICGEWFEGAVVNHKNEDKTDNRAENLEWITQKENINYGTHNQRISNKMTNGKLSKPVLQYDLNGVFIKEWPSANEIQRQLGYNQSNISCCCRGEYRQANGYIWKYEKEAS